LQQKVQLKYNKKESISFVQYLMQTVYLFNDTRHGRINSTWSSRYFCAFRFSQKISFCSKFQRKFYFPEQKCHVFLKEPLLWNC